MSNQDDEMSMEEILASIRRYVSDDTPQTNQSGLDYTTGHTADVIRLTDAVDQGKAPKSDFIPYAKVNDTAPPNPKVHPKKADIPSFHDPQPPSYTQPSAPSYQKTTTTPMAGLYKNEMPAPPVHAAPFQEAPSIISQDTMNATTSAFSKLTDVLQTVKTEKDQYAASQKEQGVSAIESFVIEMARPMIRQWIDQNLPTLVDKLVTQEIEKLMNDLRKKML
ncbi:MAG: hypothetical protein CNLJKLNK_01178 [Holosporales bacterium]